MKLFKIYITVSYSTHISTAKHSIKYIVAESQRKAFYKYIQEVKPSKNEVVHIEYLCERDEIIPTVEPKKESFS